MSNQMTQPNQSNHIPDIRKMVVDNTQENKTSEIVQVDEGDVNGFESETDSTQELDEIIKFAYEGEVSWIYDQLGGTLMIGEQLQYIEDHKAETRQAIQELIDRKVKEALDERQKSKS